MEKLPNLIAMLWPGALLGGSFISAPAKFSVETLCRAELIAVRPEDFWRTVRLR
ncbi:MAG: hypothetical protein AAGF78_15235 [Pseudomonadota bacterium]